MPADPSATVHGKGVANEPGGPGSAPLRQLSPLLVWAVVFADIGTSIYYVPGILHQQVGDLAPLFVATALLGFVLLAAKYVEICWRYPEGGGVVTVATEAFSQTFGALGGILICIDYFLTAAISSVSGIEYLGKVVPYLHEHVVLFSVAILALLAAINIVGIRESAAISLVMAATALLVDLVLIGWIALTADHAQWQVVLDNLSLAREVDFSTFLIGFGGAWLAFSGLESISQLSPAMRLPIRTTAFKGMRLVVITILLTSPVLTLFSVALLDAVVKTEHHERFISELALHQGGRQAELAVVFTAAALLLFAANTAIIGSYHVFLALAKNNYMPATITSRNRRFRTPHVAILVATVLPVVVILLTGGDLVELGELYAFGLLGAFVLSSIGLDVLRWNERRRGVVFWLGILTSVLVLIAWLVNLHEKNEATFFGILLLALGMLVAIGTRKKFFTNLLYQIPLIARRTPRRIAQSEHQLESVPATELLSLSQAKAVAELYPSSTLVALRVPNDGLVAEAITRERGKGGTTIYALFVEERAGLFVGGAELAMMEECAQTMKAAIRVAEKEGFTVLPVWTVSYNAVEGIVRAAEELDVSAVLVGVSQRGAIYGLLRGHVVGGLTKSLPSHIHLLLYG